LLISWKIWRASKPKRPQALKLLYPVTPSPEALLSLAREQAALDLFSTPRRTRAGTRAWGKTRGTDGGAVAHRQFTLWPRSTGNQAFRTVCRAILRIPSCRISCPRSGRMRSVVILLPDAQAGRTAFAFPRSEHPGNLRRSSKLQLFIPPAPAPQQLRQIYRATGSSPLPDRCSLRSPWFHFP